MSADTRTCVCSEPHNTPESTCPDHGAQHEPDDLSARMAEAIANTVCDHVEVGAACSECRAAAALSVRSEHEAQLAGRWGDATRRAELAETRMERLKADLEDAYADRDQQFERKVAALRERDEAKQHLAEALSTIAAHERHINDTFETNRRALQEARDRRDEAQDERDSLIDEVRTLQQDLDEFGEAQKTWLRFRRERDELKAKVVELEAELANHRANEYHDAMATAGAYDVEDPY